MADTVMAVDRVRRDGVRPKPYLSESINFLLPRTPMVLTARCRGRAVIDTYNLGELR